MNRALIVVAATLALASPACADFASCLASLRADAAGKGVSEQTIAAAFDKLQPDPKVLDFETNQPEFKTPIWDYMAGLVDDERVADGKAAMARESNALAKAEARFGVDRHVLAAIWGVESNFGEDMGGRPLVQSLATLACQSESRPDYYRGELMAALTVRQMARPCAPTTSCGTKCATGSAIWIGLESSNRERGMEGRRMRSI